jgi:hypothetical protein
LDGGTSIIISGSSAFNVHGTILIELEKYVTARRGAEAWTALRAQAGIPSDRTYEVSGHYPDEEVAALVTTGSRIIGQAPTVLLEDFGEFIAPDLLSMYPGVIDPAWRTLEVIEHTESTIHTIVRLDHRGAAPPYLQASRSGPNEVTIRYTSARRLCSVAKGISRGIARHYGESVSIREERCMHRGDGECVLVVEKLPA